MNHCLWATNRWNTLKQAGQITSMNLYQARASPCQSARNRSKLGSKDCYDTDLIYSRVMGLMSSREIDLKELFSHELAPIPTSMFEDNGDMRITQSNSSLKQKLQVEQSSQTLSFPDTIIIDGCALLWIIQWPNQGVIQDFVNNVLEYVFRKFEHSDVYVIFDRYFEYSTKSATRTSHAAQQASQRHELTSSTPLPSQTIGLRVTENKQQIISTICEQLKEKGKIHNETSKHRLLVTGPSSEPIEIFKGVGIQRKDLELTHEEADVIIPSQVVDAATQGSMCIKAIRDDTDAFILHVHYYIKCSLKCKELMEGSSKSRTLTDIGETANQHADIGC